MLVEVIVPVMLRETVCVPLGQGADPVMVMAPPESVPVKLYWGPFVEVVTVPLKALPDCETAIVPTEAVRVVAPFSPSPTPDCATVVEPEELP
jgi:hypothetical protein